MNKFTIIFLLSSNVVSIDLEKEFWDCDYIGSSSMLSFNEATHCSEIFEKLKKEKFDDNWNLFYTWWLQNKTSEHQKRQKNSI